MSAKFKFKWFNLAVNLTSLFKFLVPKARRHIFVISPDYCLVNRHITVTWFGFLYFLIKAKREIRKSGHLVHRIQFDLTATWKKTIFVDSQILSCDWKNSWDFSSSKMYRYRDYWLKNCELQYQKFKLSQSQFELHDKIR